LPCKPYQISETYRFEFNGSKSITLGSDMGVMVSVAAQSQCLDFQTLSRMDQKAEALSLRVARNGSFLKRVEKRRDRPPEQPL